MPARRSFRSLAGQLFTGATGLLVMITIGMLLVRMVNSVVLSRLLEPSAFGLIGIINSIFFTVVMLTDLGFRSHVVRHPQGDDPFFGDVIWTIHATRGFVIGGLSVVGAPVLAAALHKPELAWPLSIASLTLTINGLASLSLFTVLRSGGARRLSLFEFGLVVFQSVAGIALAFWLRSAWSLVFSMILQSCVRTSLSYIVFPNAVRRLARDRAISREFLAFSRVVLVSSAMTLALSQTDRFVLARAFTLGEFGLYAIAINIATAPSGFVDSFITRVNFPIYARTWNNAPQDLKRIFYTSGRKGIMLFGLGCGVLIGAAPMIITLLYDPRYHAAWTYVSILALGPALKMRTFATNELMTAKGKVKQTVYCNIVRTCWLATAGTAGFLTFGAFGLIGAVGLIEVPALLFSWYTLQRDGLLSLRKELAYLGMVAAGATAAGTCSYMLLG